MKSSIPAIRQGQRILLYLKMAIPLIYLVFTIKEFENVPDKMNRAEQVQNVSNTSPKEPRGVEIGLCQ